MSSSTTNEVRRDAILKWIAGDQQALLVDRAEPNELDRRVLDKLREILFGVLPRAREIRLAEPGDVEVGLLLGLLPETEFSVDNLRAWVLFLTEDDVQGTTQGECALGMETQGLVALGAAAAFLRDFSDAQITDAWGYPLLCFERSKEDASPVTLNHLRLLDGKAQKLQFFFAPRT